MNFSKIKFICDRISDDGELCRHSYFKALNGTQPSLKYYEDETADGLYIKLTMYIEEGLDSYVQVTPYKSGEKRKAVWKSVQLPNYDLGRLIEKAGGPFQFEDDF